MPPLPPGIQAQTAPSHGNRRPIHLPYSGWDGFVSGSAKEEATCPAADGKSHTSFFFRYAILFWRWKGMDLRFGGNDSAEFVRGIGYRRSISEAGTACNVASTSNLSSKISKKSSPKKSARKSPATSAASLTL